MDEWDKNSYGEYWCGHCRRWVDKFDACEYGMERGGGIGGYSDCSGEGGIDMSENQENNRQYVITRSPKSIGLGLILTLVLGPIGLLYATVSGGIIMIIVDSIFALVGLFTLGFSLFVTIPIVNLICMIWAYVKIKKYNEALFSGNLEV